MAKGHSIGQHDADGKTVIVANATVLTNDQLDDLKQHIADLVAATRAPQPNLTDMQFQELKAMLAPGAELSKLMLDEYKAAHGPRAALTTREIVQGWGETHNPGDPRWADAVAAVRADAQYNIGIGDLPDDHPEVVARVRAYLADQDDAAIRSLRRRADQGQAQAQAKAEADHKAAEEAKAAKAAEEAAKADRKGA